MVRDLRLARQIGSLRYPWEQPLEGEADLSAGTP
jgi:hypothetical protein